jgi:hypothetical protein
MGKKRLADLLVYVLAEAASSANFGRGSRGGIDRKESPNRVRMTEGSLENESTPHLIRCSLLMGRARRRMASYKEDPSYKRGFIQHCR